LSGERGRRLLIGGGSLALTGLLLYLALLLGGWGFDTRRYAQHAARLRNLLARAPRLEQVVAGLEAEGSRQVAAPEGEAALRRIARERAGLRADEVVRKGLRWKATRVFVASDMVYFIYFDDDGLMRDFTCVSR
jgi:hypothetical protein